MGYSSLQILFEKENDTSLDFCEEDRKCRICGGRLTKEHESFDKLSGSWTDEAMLQNKESEQICTACSWFTGKGFKNIWESKHVLIADKEKIHHLGYSELMPYLSREDLPFPLVISVKGLGTAPLQKHTEFRTLHAVSTSDENMFISFCYLKYFDAATVDGVASFRRREFVDTVYRLADMGRRYILPTVNSPSEWKKRNDVFARLYACSTTKSPNSYLACFLAAYEAVPEKRSEIS